MKKKRRRKKINPASYWTNFLLIGTGLVAFWMIAKKLGGPAELEK